MNIAVYGAASDRISRTYIEETEKLCKELGSRGHSLVFGGGGVGIMGAAARGFQAGGGEVIGILPKFFKDEGIEDLYENCDKLILTESLQERKAIMEEMAEAFIVGPGGIGTYDEFFEALTLGQLGMHDKPILLFNVEGFYEPMQKVLEKANEEGFLRAHTMTCYKLESDIEAAIKYLEEK